MTPAVLIGISALFWRGLGPCHQKIPATAFQRDSFLAIGDGDSSQAPETPVIGALFLLLRLSGILKCQPISKWDQSWCKSMVIFRVMIPTVVVRKSQGLHPPFGCNRLTHRKIMVDFNYLEPQTTIYKWLFQWDDSKSLCRKWLFHQTSIKKMVV